MRTATIFDLETTGTDLNKSKIVSICIVKAELGQDIPISIFHQLINPQVPIPPEVVEVHGISNEKVKNCPTFGSVCDHIGELLKGETLIGGYNVQTFDIPILARQLEEECVAWDLDEVVVLDAYRIWQKMERRQLADAVRRWTGDELEDAHDAEADAIGSLRVLNSMFKLKKEGVIENIPFDRVDAAGKFLLNDEGEVVFGFGKHRGTRVYDQLSYVQWMKANPFPEDTRKWCNRILAGESALMQFVETLNNIRRMALHG